MYNDYIQSVNVLSEWRTSYKQKLIDLNKRHSSICHRVGDKFTV